MTRALFGAGILGVEIRNSDQGNALVIPGSCGSRLKTQVPQLRMEGMELGICLRVPASHGQPHCMPLRTTLQASKYWSHMSGSPGQAH